MHIALSIAILLCLNQGGDDVFKDGFSIVGDSPILRQFSYLVMMPLVLSSLLTSCSSWCLSVSPTPVRNQARIGIMVLAYVSIALEGGLSILTDSPALQLRPI